nr:MAG TPA: hypothetical protein [Caudoviricetes sp.]
MNERLVFLILLGGFSLLCSIIGYGGGKPGRRRSPPRGRLRATRSATATAGWR